MNAAIEIHDSDLGEIATSQGCVLVRLNRAYIHRSTGRPGHDAGSGWSQPVDIVLFGGLIETPLPEMPCTLEHGRLSSETNLVNLIPIPFALNSSLQFELHTLHGDRIVIRGTGIEVKAAGEAIYVEEFPGTEPSGGGEFQIPFGSE
jgi:hypothetical protein